jgi:Tol biopolymer transport system component
MMKPPRDDAHPVANDQRPIPSARKSKVESTLPSLPRWLLLVAAASLGAQPTLEKRAALAGSLPPAQIERVNLSNAGTQLTTCPGPLPRCTNSSHPTISYDGSLVAFDSDANNVVPNFANSQHSTQIYVRDIQHHKTILISAAHSTGNTIVEPDNGSSFPDISGDGNWVVFSTTASNLVPGDGDQHSDVFLAHIAPFSLQRLSQNPGGAALDGESLDAVVSYDGRFVAFASSATNFADLRLPAGTPPPPRPSGNFNNVFVLDRTNGSVEWLSIASPLQSAPNGASNGPTIDEDGNRISFTSEASDLFAADANGQDLDVFVRDRANGALICASVRFDTGATGNGTSHKSVLSGNGRYVAFESLASDLLPPGIDTNGVQDVFVRDLDNATTVRVSVSSAGAQANAQSGYSALSSDGRFVAFTSFADNLVTGDTTHSFFDFFVRDRDVSGNGVFDETNDVSTRRLSVSSNGVEGNARSGGNCDLSAAGEFAVFMSEANRPRAGRHQWISLESSMLANVPLRTRRVPRGCVAVSRDLLPPLVAGCRADREAHAVARRGSVAVGVASGSLTASIRSRWTPLATVRSLGA